MQERYYVIVVLADNDDSSMNNLEVKEWVFRHRAYVLFHQNLSKIEAVNQALSADINYLWDVNVTVSDDQMFLKKGFDLDIIDAFTGFDGLVHFKDEHNPTTCTMSMVSRRYSKIDNFIYHPDLYSVFCDNLQKDLAIKRKKYRYIDRVIYTHYHYRWKLAKKDELYERNDNQKVYQKDRETYLRLLKEYQTLCL